MAQPNLSAVIRRLEESLAVRLFRRKPRVEPTEAGLVLLTGAHAIFDQMHAIVERVKLAGDGRIGVVRAGFASTAMLTSLPDHLRVFRRDFPDIALQLREMHSAAQWTSKAGAIDAAITREVQSDAAISRKIVVLEKFVAIVPKQHALAGRSIVRVRDLAAEPFVLCRRAAPALKATRRWTSNKVICAQNRAGGGRVAHGVRLRARRLRRGAGAGRHFASRLARRRIPPHRHVLAAGAAVSLLVCGSGIAGIAALRHRDEAGFEGLMAGK